MKRRFTWKRAAGLVLVGGLVMLLAGDNGRATITVTPGIDPLEVLGLQIKPNVILVLDSSGSMNDTVGNNTIGGDHPDSKIGSAKRVLLQAIQNNETKVNFMFGTYTQSTSASPTQTPSTLGNTGMGNDRFSYWAKSSDSPSMLTTELFLNQVYAFQTISAAGTVLNNILYFQDNVTNITCAIPAGFYVSGTTLATQLQTSMNACSAGNGYVVTYTAGTGIFAFSRTGARNFRMRWSQAASSIRAVLAAGTTDTTLGAGPFSTGNARINALRKIAGDGKFTEAGTTFYEATAGRFYNGQTFYVLNNTGTVCGQAAAVVPTNPPSLNLQQVSNCASPTTSLVNPPVNFVSAGGGAGVRGGGGWGSNAVSCNGFLPRVQLIPCNLPIPPNPAQSTTIGTPFLQPSLRIDTTAGPTFGQPIGYTEVNDGTGTVTGTVSAYGVPGDGSTPIANSLRDIKTVFDVLWGTGAQPPAPLGPVVVPPSGTIASHTNPKEKTVVVFVTDGDDTCSGSGDPAALAAAGRAQDLYQPIVGGVQVPSGYLTSGSDAASSVMTYVVGYGTGAQVNRLNWIAWGGSGMQQGASTGAAWTVTPTAAQRALCATCQDAYIAPTPAALAAVLNAIFNQGAQSGEFTAQQSVTDAVYEYVDKVPAPVTVPATPPFSAFAPYNRYDALAPIKYVSSFTLPGFNGQLKAYRNVAGAAALQWSAGDKLFINVTTGMNACPLGPNAGAAAGECNFTQLHGGATDATIGTSGAAIKRRIYTTTQNGYFAPTISNLLANVAPFRVPLWPPTALSVAPADYVSQGLLDGALGLPLDTSTTLAADFTALQNNFSACQASASPTVLVVPPGCTSVAPLTKMQAARREAREMILAFMAGATPSLDNAAKPKRVQTGTNQYAILYHAKAWILAEAALATPAIVGPPIESTPDGTTWLPEYDLYVKGERDATGPNAGKNTASATQIDSGFGLTNPDKDNPAVSGNDARAIKPVMTVVYAGANDMLHAFRAGPNVDTTATVCTYTGIAPNATPAPSPRECGGDELWGFVPYDSLSVLGSRYINQPPKRLPHDYMIAASIRFNDIFVPSATPLSVNVGGVTVPGLNGVWRKVIYFGRGIGGKYYTALDVTAPGTFQRQALATNGPIPLWNRGNPDTNIGPRAGGTPNNPAGSDLGAYAHMGQTWSTPAVVFVDKTNNTTIRKPGGVDFVMYTGSGYGDTSGCPSSAPCEGSFFYALDALTGDVIKSVDVEATAASFGLGRSPKPLDNGSPPQPYDNAIVSDPVGFNPIRFVRLTSPHPSAAKTTRVYVADVYGRLWKFLTGIPNNPWPAIPAADLGVTQPVGTAASLIGLKPPPGAAPGPNAHIYVTSGNENRANGPFSVFAFRDDGDDTTTATSGTQVFGPPTSPPGPGVTTFLPVVTLFTRTFDQGPVVNATAPSPFPVFRGTAQPATAFTTDNRAVTFFVGTRFNAPLTAFAPVPPPYPCRSSFDSIIYALGARSGLAAYDLNAAGDDAFSIYKDSRVVAISTQSDPGQGSGSRLSKDEGLAAAAPDPPPAPGRPQGLSSNVRPAVRAGKPFPAMKFGSTVCQ